MPRGRPAGWRKVDPRSASIMVRLSPAARAWLAAQAKSAELSESEIVRQLIEREMVDVEGGTRMRGYSQVGHDAVVVWSPSQRTHAADLQAQLERGCTERPRGSFQKAGGLYFSWLDAPRNKCELCGGRCRLR